MLLTVGRQALAYDLVGPEGAPAVAFIHSLAADSGMWTEQVPPLLAAGFQALRVDLRGHGGSSPVPGNYAMEQLAGDLIAVMDALALPSAHIVGLSIGGMIAQCLALDHAARVRSLVLCDSQPASPADALTRWGPRMVAVQKAGTCEPLGDATMGRWFTDAFRAARPARWRAIRDTIVSTTPQGYIGCAYAIQHFDFRPRLPSLRTPTLVVVGADDPGAPPGESQHIAKLIPGSRFTEIPNARHLPNVERPEVFNQLLLDWLREHP